MERRVNGDYHSPFDQRPIRNESSPSKLFPVVLSPSPSSTSSVGVGAGGGGLSYIEHHVSRFDTLAGVAIKYGVEVADIKRINGLVTDHQMFALRKLQIPSPGRHPPSSVVVNGSDKQGTSSIEQKTPTRRHSDLFDSFGSLKLKASPQRKVSPAIGSLQGYYGHKSTDKKVASEGFEMAVYRNGGPHYLEDSPFSKPSSHSNSPLSHHRKSISVANGLMSKNGDLSHLEVKDDSGQRIDMLLSRRRNSEVDLKARTPELLLKEDNTSGGFFSALAVKGLALRPKAANRIVLGTDGETSGGPTCLGDSIVADSTLGVRKSSSTPSLQDSESNASSSMWSTSMWNLKPDLQALSAAAITRPIFDSLPKPISGRKSKTALD